MAKNNSSVCIVGYPRSGTTLIYHILMSADVFPVFPFDETHFFSHFYKMYGNLNNKCNLDRLIKEIKNRKIIDNDLDFQKIISKQAMSNKITYELVFSLLMNTLAKRLGKTAWVEKTPWHMLYMKQIIKSVPTVKIIFLIRDPRAVAMSIDKAGWVSGGKFLRYASAWKWHMDRAEMVAQLLPNKILKIKYEEIVYDLEKTLQKINTFLNIELSIEDVQKKKIGVVGGTNTSFWEYSWRKFNIYRGC